MTRSRSPRKNHYYVYLLQCEDGTYYAGYTNNLESRVLLHNAGRGAKYLRGRLPARLVYAKEYRYYKNALRAERYLKQLTRVQKRVLVQIHTSHEGVRHA